MRTITSYFIFPGFFKNIFLLNSTTNLAESNGHISYTVKAFPGVELMTQVNNKADIYFDFNPPVVTNTASSIMVNDFTVSYLEPGKAKEIMVFPNPTNGIIYFSTEVASARIFNLEGKLLMSGKDVDQMDIRLLSQGIYLLSLITEGVNEVHTLTLMP